MRVYALDHSSYPDFIIAHLSRTLKPHTSPVITSAVDRTGTLLSTGDADGTVKVWDIRGGYISHTLHGHSGVISALHFFEVGGSDHDDGARTSAKPRKKKRRKSDPAVEESYATDDVEAISYRVASGSEDGKIRIWNLQNRKCIAVLEAHVSVVRSLDFDENKNFLVSGSRDKTVMLWDTKSWTLQTTVPVLESVEATGFLNSGSLVYTGGETGRLRLWHVGTGREATQERIAGREGQGILDIICHPALPFLLSVHADQTLVLHSLEPIAGIQDEHNFPALPVLRRISGTHDEVIDLTYIGGNRSMLAVATNTEDIRILSLDSSEKTQNGDTDPSEERKYFGSDVALLNGHEDIIICLDIDWSGHWLATGAKDNTAKLWRIDPEHNSFTCFATFTGHAESLGAIALPKATPLSGTAANTNPLEHPPAFLMTGSQDKTVKRWDMSSVQKDTKKAARATYTRKAHDKDINALDISHNSTFFASASQDRTVKIWSLEDGEAVGVLRGHRRGVWSVKFAPKDTPQISGDNGQASSARGLILTGSGDKTIKIWSLSDYSCLRTFEGHTNSVLKVVWMSHSPSNSEDGHDSSKRTVQVATAGGDGLVKIWDANTGELECTLDNHIDRVWALAVHPTTNALISGGADSVITFWKDTTTSTVAAAAAASTARVEQDQQLQNLIRAGSYRSAITLALQLNHPARLLALFTSVTNTFPAEQGSLCGVLAVDEVLASLGDEQLGTLLLRVRDWNTNAKTAPVAQKVLWTLLKSYPAERFTKLRVGMGGTAEGANAGASGKRAPTMKEVLDGLKAYTERHYRRMEDLIDESYLVEYTLREMDEVWGEGGVVRNGAGEDVVMVG